MQLAGEQCRGVAVAEADGHVIALEETCADDLQAIEHVGVGFPDAGDERLKLYGTHQEASLPGRIHVPGPVTVHRVLADAVLATDSLLSNTTSQGQFHLR